MIAYQWFPDSNIGLAAPGARLVYTVDESSCYAPKSLATALEAQSLISLKVRNQVSSSDGLQNTCTNHTKSDLVIPSHTRSRSWPNNGRVSPAKKISVFTILAPGVVITM